MSDLGFPEEEQSVAGGSLRTRHIVLIVAVALALVGVAYWWLELRHPVGDGSARVERVTPVPQGSRTVTLYFADADTPALVDETRQVAVGHGISGPVAQVIRALLAGPEHKDALRAIPAATRLQHVYFDEETYTVYLDFSAELVADHPGGSAAEVATVKSIVGTVSSNFPEIRRVQLLVDGLQVGTLAGHVNVYGPLYVEDWR